VFQTHKCMFLSRTVLYKPAMLDGDGSEKGGADLYPSLCPKIVWTV
jgi:hypothetical protein